MKFHLNEHKKNIPIDDLLADVRKVAGNAERDKLTTREYRSLGGKFGIETIIRKFGSWANCLAAAGLNSMYISVPRTNEELFENIKEVWVTLGKQPSFRDMNLPISKFRAQTYTRRFESWRKALEAFVDFINQNTPNSVGDAPQVELRKRKTSRDINWRLRFLVMRRDNFRCNLCGASPATDPTIVLQVDHILAYSKGGETIFENLQTTCSKCNQGKSDLPMEVEERS